MNVSSAREMNDSLAITASSLAITEKKPQRPGGCVGIFFQLFDWNRRFAKKKLFPKKLLSPDRLKQASKKFGGDEKQPKIRLIANENSGGFPNVKNNGMTNTCCESKRKMKAPSVVARLMGLESMPAASGSKPKKASGSEIGSNVAEKLGAQPGGSDKEDMDFEKAEIKRELRPQKLQKIGLSERRSVCRFSAEALQLRTVLSRPRKHQPKLVSPVKSPRNVSGRNASRLIGAATRILEPGLQKSRVKCALTYPTRYFSPLEDKADLAPHHLEGPNPCVDSKTLKGTSVPSCKNCGYFLHSKNGIPNVEEHSSSVSSPISSYSGPPCHGPGRNIPKLPIFSSRNQLERVSEGSSSDATAEIDDVSYCAELILGKRSISRSRMEMHGTRQGNNVKKDASPVTHVLNQKQNQTSQNRERGLMKSKPSSLQSNRVLAAAESMNNTKNFVAQNRRLGASTRLRLPATADGCKFETERKPYSSRSDSFSPVRKKRLNNVSRQGDSSSFVNANMGRESSPSSDKTSRKDVAFPICSVDSHSTKPKLPCLREGVTTNNSSEGCNVVSFTFKSAMKQKAGIHAEVTKRKSQNYSSVDATRGRSFFKGNDEAPCLHKSFPLKGDILGALLEQKLKELTSEEEFGEGGAAPRKSTATILQELITALNEEKQFHLDSSPVRPSRKEDLCDDGDVSSRNTCINFQAIPDSAATDLVGNSLDHHSPGCVLEAAFSTDSYLSSSPNSSSKDKVLAESVDSIDDEPLFPEPDRDLSDCETSLSTRSCRALITDHFNNVSGLLSKIDQLKGSKLSYAKEVILNTELIFRTTPQQQALPVEDGFSVSHFLLNELEMLSSLLWMTFSQLLGCNDPKQMNQLKGFAFDCLLEYLDSKFARYSDSGFRTWTKLPSSMTKEILIADIIEEVKEWTEFVGLIPDELIEWDMSHSLGWIVSTVLAGAFVGSFTGGALADQFGRTKTFILDAIPLAVGAFLCTTAQSVQAMIIGRLLTGIGIGISSAIVPLYISEISPTEIRGTLGTVNQLFICIGILAALVAGLPLSGNPLWWRTMFGISLIPSVLLALGMAFSPESPRWLYQQGRISEAETSIKRLYGKERVAEVMGDLEDASQGSSEPDAGWLDLFSSRYWKVVSIGAAMFLFQQLAGINAVVYYSTAVFRSAGITSDVAASALVGSANVFGTMVASSLMDKQGRKSLLLISFSGMAASMMLLSLSFTWKVLAPYSGTLAVLGTVLYVLSFSLGAGPVPALLLPEIFASRIRAKAVALSLGMHWIMNFFIGLYFLSVVTKFGISTVYLGFASVCLLAVMYIAGNVVETKGRSLEDIERELSPAV